jgi:peptide methionine sulfoxide reductase MsrB
MWFISHRIVIHHQDESLQFVRIDVLYAAVQSHVIGDH